MKSPLLFPPPGQGNFALKQADALFNQALALYQRGQHGAALPLFDQVIQLNPRHGDALHLAGVLSLQAGNPQRAVDLITRCIKIDRHNASAHANRGAACQALGQVDLAMLNFNKAIELNPRLDSGWNNRGNLLMALDRNEQALADLDQALAIQPLSFEAHNNRGNALSRLRRYEEATASFQRAVEIAPNAAISRWNLGMNLLRTGHFASGWRHAEARLQHWRSQGWQARAATPLAEGEALEGKTILLYRKQGLGDTLQFSRFARAFHERGAQVILEVQPELADLLRPACAHAQVVATGDELPPHSHSCPLLSAPWVLGTTQGDIPAPTTGLEAPASRRQAWQARLGARVMPRIGIAWSGNPKHVDDAHRSIALSTFTSLLREGFEWISLHKDVRDTDAPSLAARPDIRSFGSELHDFCDTAALVSHLDLVICVDSSVAHLAASLGKETWVLLPSNADWRWLVDRQDSPWYPSMTLFRQAERGNWPEALQRVQAQLMDRFRPR